MHDFDGFVKVVVKATGEKQTVPRHYLDDSELMKPFELPPSAREEKAPKTTPANPGGGKTPVTGD